MVSLIINNIDRQLYEALRIAADINGLSIEEQACLILSKALEQSKCTDGLGTRIHKRFSIDDGVELDLPSR
ncbi:plasmid stabilization protein [Pseudomonas laurylsulfatiphila]|nr:plasmid stabilization protein [Pseudomonas laurylsulfatiphila]UVM05796.1 plasmid stabilization protein [Pseudomonas laurylsulfatiphila]